MFGWYANIKSLSVLFMNDGKLANISQTFLLEYSATYLGHILQAGYFMFSRDEPNSTLQMEKMSMKYNGLSSLMPSLSIRLLF